MAEITLHTERLLLRTPRLEDLDAWAAFSADPETMRYLGGVQSRSAAWRAMMCMAGSWQLQGFAMFSVIERDSGRWLGRIGPWVPADWPGTEVGWGLCAAAQGKGYAVEAATAAIDWAFDQLGWTEVIHCIDPDNRASQRVAERLGARNLRRVTLPPPHDTMTIDAWGQTREEWRQSRRLR
ncbi:MAG: GNAT family N-acetyltransferase [Lysobacterales bacterium 69-70]|nr:GNAT family N-acetyltransferase [Xanthomonadaceae bacterium]ODU32178.1 MAG: GNAT family N-acetyltransferase [Xanthomonadaceae bacterium SCN 69-320]ODV19040.1 MAG: GNAT family N-acetyltransferase [Xanthomonadaceae bacterium SCN 69-25]OJZ01902.1 MAG: GNAT family N-acetyltransferase [Xanthomonadales bacterium 69-70]